MKLTEEQIIDIYKSINYSKEWFDNHKYQYRLGQGFDPYIGEYFLVDLYFDKRLNETEVWLVKGSKPKYDSTRKHKLPFIPVALITYNGKFGMVNGYWQALQYEK